MNSTQKKTKFNIIHIILLSNKIKTNYDINKREKGKIHPNY